jgi:hypothetical protein
MIPGLASLRTSASATSKSEDTADRNYTLPHETSTAVDRVAIPSTVQSASTPQLSQSDSQTAEIPDDLEELAERAFAISPRLGAMDEVDDDVPMFSDPLDELLGEIENEEVERANSAHEELATPTTQAPATQAPATQAPATQAPATQALATQVSANLSAQSSVAAEALSAQLSSQNEPGTSILEASGTGHAVLVEQVSLDPMDFVDEGNIGSDFGRADDTKTVDAAGMTVVPDASVGIHDARLAYDQGGLSGDGDSQASNTATTATGASADSASSLNVSKSNEYGSHESSTSDFNRTGLDWDEEADETNETARNEQEDVAKDTQDKTAISSQDEDNTNQSATSAGFPQNPPPLSGGPPPRRRRT